MCITDFMCKSFRALIVTGSVVGYLKILERQGDGDGPKREA